MRLSRDAVFSAVHDALLFVQDAALAYQHRGERAQPRMPSDYDSITAWSGALADAALADLAHGSSPSSAGRVLRSALDALLRSPREHSVTGLATDAASDDPVLRQRVQAFADSLQDYIEIGDLRAEPASARVQSLLAAAPVGGCVLIPAGWSGHAIAVRLRRDAPDRWSLTVFNSGEGLTSFHPGRIASTGDKCRAYTGLAWTGLPRSRLLGEAGGLTALLRGLVELGKHPGAAERCLPEDFYSLVHTLCGTEGEPTPTAGSLQTPQRAGTCATQCLYAALRAHLDEDPAQYKAVKMDVATRLDQLTPTMALARIYERLGQVPHAAARQQAIERTHTAAGANRRRAFAKLEERVGCPDLDAMAQEAGLLDTAEVPPPQAPLRGLAAAEAPPKPVFDKARPAWPAQPRVPAPACHATPYDPEALNPWEEVARALKSAADAAHERLHIQGDAAAALAIMQGSLLELPSPGSPKYRRGDMPASAWQDAMRLQQLCAACLERGIAGSDSTAGVVALTRATALLEILARPVIRAGLPPEHHGLLEAIAWPFPPALRGFGSAGDCAPDLTQWVAARHLSARGDGAFDYSGARAYVSLTPTSPENCLLRELLAPGREGMAPLDVLTLLDPAASIVRSPAAAALIALRRGLADLHTLSRFQFRAEDRPIAQMIERGPDCATLHLRYRPDGGELVPSTSLEHPERAEACKTLVSSENAAWTPGAAPGTLLPRHELNRLLLARSYQALSSSMYGLLAHYSSHVRDLLQPDAQLEFLEQCVTRACHVCHAQEPAEGILREPVVTQVADILTRLLDLASGDGGIHAFVAAVCARVEDGAMVAEWPIDSLCALRLRTVRVLQQLASTAATPAQRGACALSALAHGDPHEAPALNLMILAQAARAEVPSRDRQRFDGAMMRAQAEDARAAREFEQEPARAAFRLLGWAWPEGPWQVTFPRAVCGELSIDFTTGIVCERGVPMTLAIPAAIRNHPAYKALVGARSARLEGGQHSWEGGLSAVWDEHGVRFRSRFVLEEETQAYEWVTHSATLPDALSGGQHVWQTLSPQARHQVLVTDSDLQAIASVEADGGKWASSPVPRVVCRRGEDAGLCLGAADARTPMLTPQQTLVWCDAGGVPRGVQMPRFGLGFTEAAGRWTWRERRQYAVAPRQPVFFGRSQVPTLTLCLGHATEPSKVLVPRAALFTQPQTHVLEARSHGHHSLADAPTATQKQAPTMMELELVPATQPPTRELRALRSGWSGDAAWRLRATFAVDALHVAAYYTADKDYAAAIACLAECVVRPADLRDPALLQAVEASFEKESRLGTFADTTAYGHAVAAHALRALVGGLGGGRLPDRLAFLIQRYEAYLDGHQNVAAALQLSHDHERAILSALRPACLSPLLQQRAAALGLSLAKPHSPDPVREGIFTGAPEQPTSIDGAITLSRLRLMQAFGQRRIPLTTPYTPREAAAEQSYEQAILHLSGASVAQLPARLRQLGVSDPITVLRDRLAMARLSTHMAIQLRNLLCNLLAEPERLAALPALLDGHAQELPPSWLADASMPMRWPAHAPAPSLDDTKRLPEPRPVAPALPASEFLEAWAGVAQPPLWHDEAVRSATEPLALAPLAWSMPETDDPVLQEQAAALAAGLRASPPRAFTLQGVPPGAEAAREALRPALLRASAAAEQAARSAHAGLEALANVPAGRATARQRLRLDGGLDQPVSVNAMVQALAHDDLAALRQLNPDLTDATLDALRSGTLDYLELATRARHLQRTLALVDSDEPEPTLRAKLGEALAVGRCYDPRLHPALLAFEHRNDLLLRPDQVAALHTLLRGAGDDAPDSGRILQLPMGAGKTKVLLPLLVHYSASEARLPVVVVPPSLLAVNHTDLARASQQAFGQPCVRFDFERSHGHDVPRLETLDRQLALAQRQRGYVITTAAAVQTLRLAYQLALDAGEAPRIEALGRLVCRFAHHGVAFIDEADQALDVRNEVVFGVGGVERLPAPACEAMALLYTRMLEAPLAERVQLQRDRQASLTPEAYAAHVLPALCQAYVADTHDGVLETPWARHSLVRRFLRDRDLSAKDQAAALALVEQGSSGEARQQTRTALALGRLLLLTTLPSCLQRNSGQHYGLPRADAPGAVAIPYRQGQPKHGSEFGCPYEAACYTLQHVAQAAPVQAAHIAATLQALQASAQQQADLDAVYMNETESGIRWKQLLQDTPFKGLGVEMSLEELGVAEQLARHLNQDMTARLRWTAKHTLPEIGSYSEQAVSDAFDLTAAFRVRRGFTGTPWNHSTYALDCETNHDTLRVLRRGLLQNPESRAWACAGEDEGIDTVVRGARAASPRPHRLRVLLDVGAFYRNHQPGQIATQLLDSLRAHGEDAHSPTGVLYFDRAGGLCYRAHDSHEVVAVDGTSAAAFARQHISMDRTAVYLDEAHCTGTDLPLPRDAVGVATVSGQTLARDLEQGIMRLRGLGTGQSVVLCASAEAAAAGDSVEALYAQTQRNQAYQLGRDRVQSVRRQLRSAGGRALMAESLALRAEEAGARFQARRHLRVQGSGMDPLQRLSATVRVDTAEALNATLVRARGEMANAGDRQALETLWAEATRRAGALPRTTHMSAQQSQHVERQVEVERQTETLLQATGGAIPRPHAASATRALLSGEVTARLGTPAREAWPDVRADLFAPDLSLTDDFRWTTLDEAERCLPRKRPLFILAYKVEDPDSNERPQFLCISQTEAAHWLERDRRSPGSECAALLNFRGVTLDEVNLCEADREAIDERLGAILASCRALDYAATGELAADRCWREWVAEDPAREALGRPAAHFALRGA